MEETSKAYTCELSSLSHLGWQSVAVIAGGMLPRPGFERCWLSARCGGDSVLERLQSEKGMRIERDSIEG